MNQFHIGGLVLTALVHGGVIAVVFGLSSFGGDDTGDHEPALAMVPIEASLAYKAKEPPPKQPQKQRRAPPPPVKPEGVSRDESKPVEPDKKPPDPRPEPEEDYEKLFEKFKEQRQSTADDEDVEIGEPTPARSAAFDGSEHGFAEVSKGDPYLQELAGQVHGSWSVPKLERGTGSAVGCVRLAADGRVLDTKLWKSSENANIDRSVKLALKNVNELRDKQTKPVPSHLLNATRQWICFNLAVENTP